MRRESYARHCGAGVMVAGARITVVQIVTVTICWIVLVATWIMLRLTETGRIFGRSPAILISARILGVRSWVVNAVAFVVGSGMAGLASILVALDIDMRPTIGLWLLLPGVVAMIVGGTGSVPGALVGGLILGLVSTSVYGRSGRDGRGCNRVRGFGVVPRDSSVGHLRQANCTRGDLGVLAWSTSHNHRSCRHLFHTRIVFGTARWARRVALDFHTRHSMASGVLLCFAGSEAQAARSGAEYWRERGWPLCWPR